MSRIARTTSPLAAPARRLAARSALALAAALGLAACADPLGPGDRDARATGDAVSVPAADQATPRLGRRYGSRNAPASPRFGRRVGSVAPAAPSTATLNR